MAFCPTCGARLQSGVPNCVACGTPSTAAAGPPSPGAPGALPKTTMGGGPAGPPPGYPSGGFPPQAPQGGQWGSGGFPPAPPQGGFPAAPPQGGFPPAPPQGQWQAPPPQQGAWGPPPAAPWGSGAQPSGYVPPGFNPATFSSGAKPAAQGGGGGMAKIAIVLVVIAAAAYFFMGAGENPKTVVNKFLDGIQDWDSQKVLDCLRPSDRAQLAPVLPQYFMKLKIAGAHVKMDNRQIDIIDQKSDTAVAKTKFQATINAPGQPPATKPMEDGMQLVKEGGHWYIARSLLLEEILQAQQQQRGRQ